MAPSRASDLNAQTGKDLYRIGTVAQLTGVAVERLRAWERRHGLAPALRVGRTRFYSREQVEQLSRIKSLVDAGHSISSVCDLSPAQLEERLTGTGEAPAGMLPAIQSAPRNGAIGFVGANLVVLANRHAVDSSLDIQGYWANLASFEAQHDAQPELGILVVQFPVLTLDEVQGVQAQYSGTRVIPVFQFATQQALRQVAEAGYSPLRWPVAWEAVDTACRQVLASLPHAAGQQRRQYTDDDLIAIAAGLAGDEEDVALAGHMVDLISQLNAFAAFALATGDAGASAAARMAVHANASEARARLEAALSAWLDDADIE